MPKSRIVALAVAALFLSVTALPAPALAQARKEYSVPAGGLEDALNAFARQASITLSFDPALVRGKSAPALGGSHTVEEGLAALLKGSGLETVSAGGGITLRRAAPQGEQALPEMKVSASGIADPTTEGSGSYTTPSMSTATGLPLSIRETPQSVTVFTRERMQDQGLTKAREVLENTPGISIEATAPYREGFVSRGFGIQTYMFDGLPITANDSRGGMFLNDLAMFDRVEVVRGAAGLTQGVGTPSAALNFIRKRPTRDFQASVEGQAGSWSYLGALADVSSPLNQSGSLRGRVVASVSDSDSYMDVVTEKRQLLYGIGELDIGRDTLLTFGASQQKNKNNTSYGGLPTAKDGSDLMLPRSTYLGNTWNYWNDTTTNLFAGLEHRLDSGWKLSFAVNHIDGDQQELRAGVLLNATDGWDQNGGYADVFSKRTSYDLNAQGPYQLFGRRHEVIVGAAVRTAKEGNDTAGYWPLILFATDIDIYNWQHNAPQPASFLVDYHHNQKEEQQGIYGTTRLNLADSLKLIVGLRLDWWKWSATDEILDHGTGLWDTYVDSYTHPAHLTKYLGITYDLNRQHTLYASYTDIFQPQNNYDQSHTLIDPIVGKNYEIGIKGAYFGGALNASAALFRVDQDNLAMDDGPCAWNPGISCSRAAGMARSEGVDLEIQGALTSRWQIGGGYTYVSTKVEKDADPTVVGSKLNTHLPTEQFKLSTTYRLAGGHWRVGGAVRWQSGVYHADDWSGYPYRSEQEAYTVVDAMLGYRLNKHLDFQFNVTNVFDEVYYRAINAQPVEWGGNTVYGDPRRFLMTARYQF